MFIGYIQYKFSFSIAMLIYQRVLIHGTHPNHTFSDRRWTAGDIPQLSWVVCHAAAWRIWDGSIGLVQQTSDVRTAGFFWVVAGSSKGNTIFIKEVVFL